MKSNQSLFRLPRDLTVYIVVGGVKRKANQSRAVRKRKTNQSRAVRKFDVVSKLKIRCRHQE